MRWLAPAGLLAVLGCLAFALPISTGPTVTADVQLREVTAAPNRTVLATVHVTPASAADDALWCTAPAWQGGGEVVDRLRNTGPGTGQSTKPLRVHEDSKATGGRERG